jgi:hypothetical protein
MTQYAVAGLIVDSELPLPELAPPAGRLQTESTLRVLARPPAFEAVEPVLEARLDDGRPWMVCVRGEHGYVVRFPDLAVFTLSVDGSAIAVHASHSTPPETVRHLFLDQVLPLALSLRGELVLHAAAVVTPYGAAAFVGDTGEGKSTLTASFATAGAPALADDCLIVREDCGGLVAMTSYPGVRLWPDAVSSLAIDAEGAAPVAHYCDKQRVLNRPAALPPLVPLCRVYLLVPDDDSRDCVRIDALSRRDGVMELLKHAYRISARDRDAAAAELARIDRVCDSCGVHQLAYPRRFEALGAVRAAILEDIARV